MKKHILFIFIFISFSFGNNISWYGSYDKALEASHTLKKDMMILIISSKQKESAKVLKKLFMNKKYIKYLNKNYINILVNIDYKTSYPIELFYTTKFPSLFFASYKDESFLIDPIYDLKDEKQLTKVLEKLKSKYK